MLMSGYLATCAAYEDSPLFLAKPFSIDGIASGDELRERVAQRGRSLVGRDGLHRPGQPAGALGTVAQQPHAVHLLGDAFAPRRVVFATRQAFELSRTLL